MKTYFRVCVSLSSIDFLDLLWDFLIPNVEGFRPCLSFFASLPFLIPEDVDPPLAPVFTRLIRGVSDCEHELTDALPWEGRGVLGTTSVGSLGIVGGAHALCSLIDLDLIEKHLHGFPVVEGDSLAINQFI